MKFSRSLGCLLAVAALTSSDRAFGQATEINAIKATVNDEVITQSEVDAAVQSQARLYFLENRENLTQQMLDAKIEELQGEALDEMIDRKLILAEFEKKGGKIQDQYVNNAVDTFLRERFDGDRAKFLEELSKTGLTIAEFKRVQQEQIAVRALRQANDGGTIINTPLELDDIYQRRGKEFATDPSIRVRLLSVDGSDGKLIEDIRRQVQDGASFATLAQEHSVDSRSSDGGLVGTIKRGEGLHPRLTEIAFQLAPKAVSEVIEDQGSLRLLYIEAKNFGDVPPVSEIEGELDKLLTQEKKKESIERWLERLRRDANIRIN